MQKSIKPASKDETIQTPNIDDNEDTIQLQIINGDEVTTVTAKKTAYRKKVMKIKRQMTPQEILLDAAKNPSKYFDNATTVYMKPMGRPKVTEENRKNNKVMMSFTDTEYEDIQRYKKILNKATITSTLEEFIKLGMEVKRKELLLELGAFSQDDMSDLRGKGF